MITLSLSPNEAAAVLDLIETAHKDSDAAFHAALADWSQSLSAAFGHSLEHAVLDATVGAALRTALGRAAVKAPALI